LDNFPIFFEYEFNLLSFNKNLLSILSFDSNSYNLIKTAQDFQKKQKKNIIRYSAGGLRDFSRIAASNEIMWRDIFFENKTNMIEAINLFMKNLKDFKKNISKKENSKIIKKLINSKVVRKQIISQKQDISKPDFGRE